MAIDVQALEEMYIGACRRHGVLPNNGFLSSLFQADVRKSQHEPCTIEISLDLLKDIDFHPLLEVCTRIGDSEIEAVDVRSESFSAVTGENALSLMQAINLRLREVDLQGRSFGKDFLRELSQRGLTCQALNLRSSNFQKLNMLGEFKSLHTLNLDYNTSLTSFREDCFSCMPNLMHLSMCETKIANLWTTIAALSKLPSLMELRFQSLVCCSDAGSSGLSGSTGKTNPNPCESNSDSYSDTSSIDLDELIGLNSSAEDAIRNLLPLSINHDFLSTSEESSDDSDYIDPSSNPPPGWNRRISLHSEVSSASLSNRSAEDLHVEDISLKYVSEHTSPICFEKHYREYMIASLPKLRVLDNLPVRNIERERADTTFSQHFEFLPYRRRHKESVVNILQNREINAGHSRLRAPKKSPSPCSGNSQHFYSRSLCASKMGSSAWPSLHRLAISGSNLRDESRRFRPRQFEYHPSDSRLMVFGTLDGEVVVVNHEDEKVVSYIPSLGAMNSVLGLCWLKNYPSKLIAGSDNGSLKLYDIRHVPPTVTAMHNGFGSVTFDEFDQLTSVHVNSSDELFLASGYSKNVALYDINSGKRLQMFTDMHRQHINVVKFSNHSPSIFATSSFDQDIKMWDLRQNPTTPCYTTSSSKGNVMVCFSPDDHYLLASAVDNEVRQLLVVDGRVHLNFDIPATGSSQNYTRSYYMNGRDYIISGSCDERVVRICCAQTGRRLRDVSLEGKGSGSSMFVQSLRGDPFRDFNLSILAAYTRPSSKSEIVKVNLLASSPSSKELNLGQVSSPSKRMGG